MEGAAPRDSSSSVGPPSPTASSSSSSPLTSTTFPHLVAAAPRRLRAVFWRSHTDPVLNALLWFGIFVVAACFLHVDRATLLRLPLSDGPAHTPRGELAGLELWPCRRRPDVVEADDALAALAALASAATPPTSAWGSGGRVWEHVVLGIGVGSLLHLAVTAVSKAARLRRTAAIVAGVIFVESVIAHGFITADATATWCGVVTAPTFPSLTTASAAGVDDEGVIPVAAVTTAVRVLMPLRYVYWLASTPPVVVMLGTLASLPEWLIVTGAVAEVVVILGGLVAALGSSASPPLFWTAFAVSGASFIWVNRVIVAALLGAHSATLDKVTTRLLAVLGPLALGLWLSFPCVWLLAYTNALNPDSEGVVWPLLDIFAKVIFSQIWVTGDFSRVDAAIEQQLRVIERERLSADASNQAKRKFMRYIFHELRVPLNAITLGLDDVYETGVDVLGACDEADTAIRTALRATAFAAASRARRAEEEGEEGEGEGVRGASGAGHSDQRMAGGMLRTPTGSASISAATLAVLSPSAPPFTAAARTGLVMMRETLEILMGNATAMGKLLDDFLSLEKIEEGKFELEIAPFRVGELVREATRMFAAPLAAKRLALAIDCRASVPEFMRGDQHKLRQVLCNLVSNAIKFSPVGGKIMVRVGVVYGRAIVGADGVGVSAAAGVGGGGGARGGGEGAPRGAAGSLSSPPHGVGGQDLSSMQSRSPVHFIGGEEASGASTVGGGAGTGTGPGSGVGSPPHSPPASQLLVLDNRGVAPRDMSSTSSEDSGGSGGGRSSVGGGGGSLTAWPGILRAASARVLRSVVSGSVARSIRGAFGSQHGGEGDVTTKAGLSGGGRSSSSVVPAGGSGGAPLLGAHGPAPQHEAEPVEGGTFPLLPPAEQSSFLAALARSGTGMLSGHGLLVASSSAASTAAQPHTDAAAVLLASAASQLHALADGLGGAGNPAAISGRQLGGDGDSLSARAPLTPSAEGISSASDGAASAPPPMRDPSMSMSLVGGGSLSRRDSPASHQTGGPPTTTTLGSRRQGTTYERSLSFRSRADADRFAAADGAASSAFGSMADGHGPAGEPGPPLSRSPSAATYDGQGGPRQAAAAAAAAAAGSSSSSAAATGTETGASLTADRVAFVRFSVIDTGPGISKEDQAKLFVPFTQIKAGALQKGNGTGLGLSICKRIVELSNGKVGLHSREGKGTVVYFQVPVYGPAPGPGISDASGFGGLPSGLSLPVPLPVPVPFPFPAAVPNPAPAAPISLAATGVLSLPAPDRAASAPGLSAVATPEVQSVQGTTRAGTPEVAPQPAGQSTLQQHRLASFHYAVSFAPSAKVEDGGDGGGSSGVDGLESLPSVPSRSRSASLSLSLTSALADSFPVPAANGPHPGSGALDTFPRPSPTVAHAPSGSDAPTACRTVAYSAGGPPAAQTASGAGVRLGTGGPAFFSRGLTSSFAGVAGGEGLHPAPLLAGTVLLPLTCAVVVDDVKSNRDFFGRMLARGGVTTLHYAEDGNEAIALHARLCADPAAPAPQAWFLDKEMPNCDGHECARRLRAAGLTPPIFGVTGNALAEDRREFIGWGASEVITKPVKAAELEQALARFGLRLQPRVRAGAGGGEGGGRTG